MERKPVIESSKFSIRKLFWSIRPVNILIVILTQLLFYYFLFERNATKFDLRLNLHDLIFPLFIITTVIITVCGYLVNDYVDFESDIINKKNNKLKSRSQYLIVYFSLLVIGLILAFYVAINLNKIELSIYYIIASALLFIYSTHLKKIPIIGNIVVAIFSAFVILIFYVFEFNFVSEFKLINNTSYFQFISILIFYSSFMFLLSFTRELLKDLEDIEGDRMSNDLTLAVINSSMTKKVITFSAILLLIVESFFVINQNSNTNIFLSLCLIILPHLYLIYNVFKAKERKEFSFTSKLAKINMFLGLLFFVILSLNN